MHSTIILIFLFTNIYVTVCFNDNTSAITRRQKDTFNFGHSGYVYLTSDLAAGTLEFAKCQYYDVNVTNCSFMNKTLKTTHDIILMRAWFAVTLRDNIVTIFSYLLHLPSDTFSNEIYSSLNLLYHELQKNNIKIMDLTPRLKSVSNINILLQLTMLFKSLNSLVPSYCKSALENISKTFSKKSDKLKNSLSSAREAGIDLFADVPNEYITLLRSRNISKNYNKNIEAFHGKEYAILFSLIVEKKLFNQPVLAVLLLNTRFHYLSPQSMEDLRYLADVLRNNKIKNWEFKAVDIAEPYDLIQKVLTSLQKASVTDQSLKDVINSLLKVLVKPSNTEEQPNYDKMKPYLNRASLNVSLFLEDLAEKFPEVVKQMSTGNKINYIVKGFIPHYYDTPEKFGFAFMQRVKNRMLVLKIDPLKNLRKVKRQTLEEYFLPPEEKTIFDMIYRKSVGQMYNSSLEIGKDGLGNGTFFKNCSLKSNKMGLDVWHKSLGEVSDAETAILKIGNVSTILEGFLNEAGILASVKKFVSDTFWENVQDTIGGSYRIFVDNTENGNISEKAEFDGRKLYENVSDDEQCDQSENDKKQKLCGFNSSDGKISDPVVLDSKLLILNVPEDRIDVSRLTNSSGVDLSILKITSGLKTDNETGSERNILGVMNDSVTNISTTTIGFERNISTSTIRSMTNVTDSLTVNTTGLLKLSNPISSSTLSNATDSLVISGSLTLSNTTDSLSNTDLKTPENLSGTIPKSANVRNSKTILIGTLKWLLNFKKVRARSIVFYEVLRLYCILVHGPNNHSLILNDLDYKNITGDLIGNNSLTVSNILNDGEFVKNLSSIEPEEYETKQLFLVALFRKMLTLEKVYQDPVVFNEVVRLLRSIIPLPIDLTELAKVITIDSLEDSRRVQVIVDFLKKNPITNLNDFDVGLYETKGFLLYAILRKSLNATEDVILNDAIRNVLPKIDCWSIGAEKVWENGERVDFNKLIKFGFEKKNMTSEVIEAFFNMTTWHNSFDPFKYVSEMNASLYETRADFIDGFFDDLARNIELKADEMKKDIDLMKTAVKKTGTGLEPIDYF